MAIPYMVVTDTTNTKGVRAYDNHGHGMSEEAANEQADRMNRIAEDMGLKVRYEVTQFVSAKQ